MSYDAYAFCPCGSGKKAKFCCSKDLLHDLGELDRILTSDQVVSALDAAKRMLELHGARPALLAQAVYASLISEHGPEAEQFNERLLAAVPHSYVGLSWKAVLAVIRGQMDAAIENMQRVLEGEYDPNSSAVMTALLELAKHLIDTGRLFTGTAHLALGRDILSGQVAQRAGSMLWEVWRSPRLPLLVKQEYHLRNAPLDAPWRGEYEAAVRSANRGAWLAACESLQALNQKSPGHAVVLWGIGVLRLRLGQDEAASQAFRDYAALPGVSEDEILDIEALCQLLVPAPPGEMVDALTLTFGIPDADRVLEQLNSDARTPPIGDDLSDYAEEGEPPPRGAFTLLDRPIPTYQDGMTLEDLPRVYGEILVYGRQTDRPARLEVELERTPRLDRALELLQSILGDRLGAREADRARGQLLRVSLEMNPEYRLPRGATREQLAKLVALQQEGVYLNVWPNLRLSVLDGHTPTEAAAVPNLRRRLEAHLLLMEMENQHRLMLMVPFDFDRLRERLGLRILETYRPQNDDESIPVSRLRKLDLSGLSDENLVRFWNDFVNRSLHLGIQTLGLELLKRPAAEDAQLKRLVCTVVSRHCDSPDLSLQLLAESRAAALASHQSPAREYLAELETRLMVGDVEPVPGLVELISKRYSQEQGVHEALVMVLQRYGLIRAPRQAVPGEAASPAGAALGASPTSAPAAEPSKLWTPGAPEARQEGSKLWLPGMQ